MDRLGAQRAVYATDFHLDFRGVVAGSSLFWRTFRGELLVAPLS